MPVPDILSSLGVGEDGISTVYPETFVDDISAAYAADMEIPAAKIQVLESELAAAHQEIAILKAHNYDLLVSVPANESDDTDTDPAPDDEPGEDEGDDSNRGVASLFKEKDTE